MQKLFVLAVAGIAASIAIPSMAAVKSGLAEGASPGAFHVLDVTGPKKGEKLCYRCAYGSKPTVTIFARETNKELAQLIKKTDQFIGKNKEAKAFVVMLTDDPDATEAKLKALAKKHDIKNVPLTIFDGKAGPASYKIAKDADVTVLMWNDSKVEANHAYKKGELNKDQMKKIAMSSDKLVK